MLLGGREHSPAWPGRHAYLAGSWGLGVGAGQLPLSVPKGPPGKSGTPMARPSFSEEWAHFDYLEAGGTSLQCSAKACPLAWLSGPAPTPQFMNISMAELEGHRISQKLTPLWLHREKRSPRERGASGLGPHSEREAELESEPGSLTSSHYPELSLLSPNPAPRRDVSLAITAHVCKFKTSWAIPLPRT